MLRFDGKVAIITGAGGGLGREYALLFAARGASVIVNDLGTTPTGEGKITSAADGVVREILNSGGNAIANHDSVENGESIVDSALKKYGRIDILINNAGILRDKSFKNVTEDDWKTIFNVHVNGTYSVTKAVWRHMCQQKSGKIITTASNSAIYGNFGQTNYSAAKSALIGFAKTLSLEGAKFNISCNAIVPTAASRLTVSILPQDLFDALHPRHVAPLVVWLCHDECKENGGVFEAGAGWFGKIANYRSNGMVLLNANGIVELEAVKENWPAITNMAEAVEFDSLNAEMIDIIDKVKIGSIKSKTTNKEWIQSFQEKKPRSRNTRFQPTTHEFSCEDAILFALSIGATLDKNVNLLYPGHENFTIFPMFAVVPTMWTIKQLIDFNIPRVKLDFATMVHGEHYLEFRKPLSSKGGRLTSYCRIADILDKGNATVALLNTEVIDGTGDLVATSQYNLFFRNAGSFDGDRESSKEIKSVPVPQNRKPDFVCTEKTSLEQAVFYRCTSGDLNPIHVDKAFSNAAGFKEPILHGLCTLAFSVRHIVDKFYPMQSDNIKSIKVRFSKIVIPGQTLITEMWKGDNERIHFQTKVKETNVIALTNGYVDFFPAGKPKYEQMTLEKNETSIVLKSSKIFDELRNKLKSDPNIAKQVGVIYQWIITVDGQEKAKYTLDLKNGTGSIYFGESKDKADVSLIISDQDMVDIFSGALNTQNAFMSGKLKIKGNIMLTTKLQKLMQSKANL